MTKALELAKFGRESAPAGVVVGDSDTQTLSAKTFSDGPVFSGLTANGVPYLNSSKVLTAGSNLTFDGTNFGVGISNPAAKLHVNVAGDNETTIARFGVTSAGSVVSQFKVLADPTASLVKFDATGAVSNGYQFLTGGSFRAQLNSSGYFSLGTATATEVLTVSNTNYEALGLYRNLDFNSVGANGVRMYFGGYVGSTATRTAYLDATMMSATTGRLALGVLIGGTLTEAVRVDTNGSVRIGGNFAAQSSTNEKLTVDGTSSQAATLANSSDTYGTVYIKNNSKTAATIQPYLYFNDGDGGNRGGFGIKYTDASTHQYAQGGFNWYVGSSGFSGLAAKLDSSGNLFVGTITNVGRLSIAGANANSIPLGFDTNANYAQIQSYGSKPLYLQALGNNLSLNSGGGYTIIGATPTTYNSNRQLQVANSILIGHGLYTYAAIDTNNTGDVILSSNANPANLGSNSNIVFKLGSSGGGGPNEIMRIISNGYVGIGTTDPQSLLTINSGGTDNTANVTINQTTDFAATSRAGFSGLANNNGGFYFGMGANGTGIPAGFGFFREATGWDTALAFYTNNQTSGTYSTRAIQEKMRLTSKGNLLLGSKLDYGKLSIRDTEQKAAVTINNDAYFKMYGKLISTYNTAVSNHALCTLGSTTNVGYIAKLTITTVSAVNAVYNVSEAYVFARWQGGTFQGATITQPVTQNHLNMSTCIFSISVVGNGSNLDVAVSCSAPNNYLTTSFDIEITCRDAGSVIWYPTYANLG